MPTPVCLFTYNRLEETKKTIYALRQNYLSKETELIVFSDGAKDNSSIDKVQEVRKFLRTISGFKEISVIEASTNKGLANSIISGVSSVLLYHKKIIVLEDDIITTRNFLSYMNQVLNFYETNDKIFSVSGYTMNLPSLSEYEKNYYLGYRASSWAWGTWKNRWEGVDWEVKDYKNFMRNPRMQLRFMRGGSDLPFMLWKQMNGRIDSWAIRWCYHQFKNNLYTVFPSRSLATSIGYGQSATHTKSTSRFMTSLCDGNQLEFDFDLDPKIDEKLTSEFRSKFSFLSRFMDKIA
jgi:hypothetical protein